MLIFNENIHFSWVKQEIFIISRQLSFYFWKTQFWLLEISDNSVQFLKNSVLKRQKLSFSEISMAWMSALVSKKQACLGTWCCLKTTDWWGRSRLWCSLAVASQSLGSKTGRTIRGRRSPHPSCRRRLRRPKNHHRSPHRRGTEKTRQKRTTWTEGFLGGLFCKIQTSIGNLSFIIFCKYKVAFLRST